MKVIFLGTGTGIFTKQKMSASIIVKNRKETLLFDTSAACGYLAENNNISFRKINHIFISHFHIDHFIGIIPILFAYNSPEYNPFNNILNIYGPQGIKKKIEKIKKIFKGMLDENGYKRNIYELKNKDIIQTNEFIIETTKTFHTKESLCFKISETKSQKKILYTSDTGYNERIIEFSNDADLCIIECSFPDKYKIKKHLSPKTALKFIEKSLCKKFILTHIYPVLKESSIYKKVVLKTKKKIIVAKDGFIIKI